MRVVLLAALAACGAKPMASEPLASNRASPPERASCPPELDGMGVTSVPRTLAALRPWALPDMMVRLDTTGPGRTIEWSVTIDVPDSDLADRIHAATGVAPLGLVVDEKGTLTADWGDHELTAELSSVATEITHACHITGGPFTVREASALHPALFPTFVGQLLADVLKDRAMRKISAYIHDSGGSVEFHFRADAAWRAAAEGMLAKRAARPPSVVNTEVYVSGPGFIRVPARKYVMRGQPPRTIVVYAAPPEETIIEFDWDLVDQAPD